MAALAVHAGVMVLLFSVDAGLSWCRLLADTPHRRCIYQNKAPAKATAGAEDIGDSPSMWLLWLLMQGL